MATYVTVDTSSLGVQWRMVKRVLDVFLGRSMTVLTLNIGKLRRELIAEKSFLLKTNNMTLQTFRIKVLTDSCQGS
jgi:hypothetical protein